MDILVRHKFSILLLEVGDKMEEEILAIQWFKITLSYLWCGINC